MSPPSMAEASLLPPVMVLTSLILPEETKAVLSVETVRYFLMQLQGKEVLTFPGTYLHYSLLPLGLQIRSQKPSKYDIHLVTH